MAVLQIEKLQKDPFRVLFPVAAVVAWLGVAPWLFFTSGLWRVWPGQHHALTMTQAFLGAVAVGFLGTMIPRRTGTPPMSFFELGAFVLLVAAIPCCTLLGALAGAEIASLLLLITLARFVIVRLRARQPGTSSPPLSFLFIPVGLVAGLTGAALLLAYALDRGTPPGTSIAAWALGPGRSLVEEGLVEPFVLALAPLLTPVIAHGGTMTTSSPGIRPRLAWAAAALAYLGSFLVQHLLNDRAGLLLRGSVIAIVLLVAAQMWRWPTAPGLHRRLYWLALAFMPTGLLAAAALPAMRLGFLHVTFIAGLSLLVFAVTFHVVFLHTGRVSLAASRPWPVYAVAALTLAAAMARLVAEQAGTHYFAALSTAASLWLGGAILWGVYLSILLLRPVGQAHP